jgi:hypothetical protein
MAIGKIEPTGCCVHKGKGQLRLSFYLEPDDPRYEEHHIQVPIIPEEGYPGEVDAEGAPVDQEHYDSWLESLPKQWQDNPFHNHFVFVDANASDAEIKQLLLESLEEFFSIWAEGEDILRAWKSRPLKSKKRFEPGDLSESNEKKCLSKVEDVIKRISEFSVVKNG